MLYLLLDLFLSSIFIILIGDIFLKLTKIKLKITNYEYGLTGILFLGWLSLFLNFFIPLSKNLNTLILISFTVIFILKSRKNVKKIITVLTSATYVTFISFIFIIYSNSNNPDAFLYHLPYTNLINDFKILPGVALIHERFGHVSLIQYVNASFNNHLFEENGITLPVALVFSFFFCFIVCEIFKLFENNNNFFSFYNYFIIFTLIFLCIRLSRYSDHGNDHPATIYFLYFVGILLKDFNNIVNNIENNFKKYLTILATFIFTLKVFYFVPLFFCVYLWFKNINKKIFNKSNYISLLIFITWISKNILVSGCLVYPASFTCINNLPWYNENKKNFTNAKTISIHAEAWAKNWNTFKKKVNIKENNTSISQKNYIKNFNWISEWSKDHGVYIMNKLLPVVLVILILLIFFTKRDIKKKLKPNFSAIVFIIFNLAGLVLWFMKFPILRYGLAYIFMQVFILSYIFFKDKKILNIKYFVAIPLSIFFIKNISKFSNDEQGIYPRIYKKVEYNFYNINNTNIFFTNKGLCSYKKSPCTNYEDNIKKINIKNYFNYKYFSIK